MSADQYISSGFLELYAMQALSPEEMQQVEEMLAQYPRLKDELDSINQGLIKYAEVYAPEPDKDLYNKILGRVRNSPKNEEPTPVVIAPPVIPIQKEKEKEKKKEKPAIEEKAKQREKAAVADKKEEPVSFTENKVRKLNGGYWVAIAACIVLLLISVSINYYQYNQYNDAKDQFAALQKENETMAENNNSLKAQFDKTDAELKLYTDPNNKMVMMKGMPISPASEVMVMWNTQNNNVFVDVHRLPTPPEGMQYQLWAIDQYGKPTSAGLLTPYKERKQKGPEQMKSKVMEAAAFAITLEPKGGSASPTPKKMYVKGSV